MTLTLADLPANEEATFRELAEAPADVRAAALAEARRVLRHGAAVGDHEAQRQRHVHSLRGKYKREGASMVEELLRERREEAARDELSVWATHDSEYKAAA